MQHYLALLRGVNVGRANRVAMADLREVLNSLGYHGPRTLLNSGNAVFGGPDAATSNVAGRLEAALSDRLGVSSRVVVLTADELFAAIAASPLGAVATDPSRLLLGFLSHDADRASLPPLMMRDWSPESLALGERVAYLWCPNGVAGSKVIDAVTRAVCGSITMRNWATVLKLQAVLLDSGS